MIDRRYNVLYKNGLGMFGKPIFLKEIKPYLKENSDILDIGSGQGRYAIPLAKLGHRVDALDPADFGIKQMIELAKIEGVKDNITDYDTEIRFFEYKKKYDAIISIMTLQFLRTKEEIYHQVKRMQKNTKVGGINALMVPSNTQKSKMFDYEFKGKEELEFLYHNWHIERSRDEKSKLVNGGLTRVVEFIARKVK